MKKRILDALTLMGFTSLVAQALLIREFLIAFYGNELTIGLILACWIISEAAGSGLASGFAGRVKSPFLIYALLQVLIAAYLPVSIFLIRDVKNLFIAILTIGPLSIFDGLQFPLGCRMHAERSSGKIEQTAGRVYILEAVGFILAGPVFTYILLTRFNSFQIAFLLGLINLLSGLSLILPHVILRTPKASEGSFKILHPAKAGFRMTNYKYFGIIILIFISLNFYILFSNISSKAQDLSLSRQWRGQNIIAYKNSIYGNLAVSQKNEQYTFYNNGVPIINIPAPDTVWTEEFVHFGLLSHPDTPLGCVKVLFLGGGAGGPINEALKYPGVTVDYAELNPLLIKLLSQYPKEITKKELKSPRLDLAIRDGARFVKRAYAEYDTVFINLPYPTTLQLNRYYTKEFFEFENRIAQELEN
jgi:spermidine synthase